MAHTFWAMHPAPTRPVPVARISIPIASGMQKALSLFEKGPLALVAGVQPVTGHRTRPRLELRRGLPRSHCVRSRVMPSWSQPWSQHPAITQGKRRGLLACRGSALPRRGHGPGQKASTYPLDDCAVKLGQVDDHADPVDLHGRGHLRETRPVSGNLPDARTGYQCDGPIRRRSLSRMSAASVAVPPGHPGRR